MPGHSGLITGPKTVVLGPVFWAVGRLRYFLLFRMEAGSSRTVLSSAGPPLLQRWGQPDRKTVLNHPSVMAFSSGRAGYG